MRPNDEHGALARFEERTRELGLHPDRSDLLVLLAGWQGLQSQLARVRRCLASELPPVKADQARPDGRR